MDINIEEIVQSLNICARTSPCPANCPRYSKGEDGEECARQLMELSATKLSLALSENISLRAERDALLKSVTKPNVAKMRD